MSDLERRVERLEDELDIEDDAPSIEDAPFLDNIDHAYDDTEVIFNVGITPDVMMQIEDSDWSLVSAVCRTGVEEVVSSRGVLATFEYEGDNE